MVFLIIGNWDYEGDHVAGSKIAESMEAAVMARDAMFDEGGYDDVRIFKLSPGNVPELVKVD